MLVFKTFLHFVLTAIAEIVGCYLPYLWLRKSGSPWLILPAFLSLALFSWLLTLHPTASGNTGCTLHVSPGDVNIMGSGNWPRRLTGSPSGDSD
jgi:small multidrug resistance family-3 protein